MEDDIDPDEKAVYYAGARYYDGLIGRFMATDRFMEKYPSLTPYQYAANNPVRFIDVNGDTVYVGYVLSGPDAYHASIIYTNPETGEQRNIAEGMPTSKTLGIVSALVDGVTGMLGINLTQGNELGWGNLEANRVTDPESISSEDREIVPIPEGMTEEQFVVEIINARKSYDDQVNYAPLPVGNRGNSNSLVGSVLRAAGSNFEPSRWAPGWRKNVLPGQRPSTWKDNGARLPRRFGIR